MHESEIRPDIGILLSGPLPPDFVTDIAKSLESDELTVRIERLPVGPYAGIELYLPAAITMFIAASYFGGFLQKAGADHFDLVMNAAKGLWKRASYVQLTPIASSSKKISNSQFSLSYAIMGEVRNGLRFKLVLQANFDQTTAEAGIEAFLVFLDDLHAGKVSDEDFAALLTYRPVGGTALVTFDPTTKRIMPVNAFERRDDAHHPSG